MDSLFEKITLYDLLGYLVPGAVCNLIVVYIMYGASVGTGEVAVPTLGLPLWAIFLLISYVVGIALSEIGTRMTKCIRKKGCFAGKGKGYNEKQNEIFLSRKGDLTEALEKVLKYDNRGKIEKKIMNSEMDRYMEIMYGDIQVSPEYKRIHNYASAYVMYKNLAVAFGIGVFMFLGKGILQKECFIKEVGILAIAMIIFISRSKRFGYKKTQYTVDWFIEKHSKEQKQKCEVGTGEKSIV